jgi:hypothetical protein
MRPGTLASLALLALLATADAFGGEPESATAPVLLDGHEGPAEGWSLEGAAAPTGPDDVLELGVSWFVVRGLAARPFRDEFSRLFEVEADGTWRLWPRSTRRDGLRAHPRAALPRPGQAHRLRRNASPRAAGGARSRLFPQDEPSTESRA